jgi:hypothetical protein
MKDKTGKSWTYIGKTEIIQNNLNPDFSQYVECDYYFEREQQMKFTVYDIDNARGGKEFIGKCETSLGKIFGSNR